MRQPSTRISTASASMAAARLTRRFGGRQAHPSRKRGMRRPAWPVSRSGRRTCSLRDRQRGADRMTDAPRTREDEIATGDPERELAPLDLDEEPSASPAPGAQPAGREQGAPPRTEADEIATGEPDRRQAPLDLDALPPT